LTESWQTFGRPTITEIERQKRFEAAVVEEGIRRYQNSLTRKVHRKDGTVAYESKEIGETDVGMRVLKDVLGRGEDGVVAAIKTLQSEIVAHITAGTQGRRPDWFYILAHRKPEELAVITIRTLLAIKYDDKSVAGAIGLTSAARRVGEAVREQFELDDWRETSKAKAKEDDGFDLANYLVSKHKGNVTRTTFRRWRRKCDDIKKLEWPTSLLVQMGSVLIDLAVRHSGGWFILENKWVNGQTKKILALSAPAKEAIRAIKADCELMHPLLRPMTCPPRPWRKEEAGEPIPNPQQIGENI
jgi:DNA-directed RNA polymerase